jgi:hypothetical protein
VQSILGQGQRDIERLRKEVHNNTEANIEMAMQERMQREQEEELALVQKLAVVRKYATEIERKRAVPY